MSVRITRMSIKITRMSVQITHMIVQITSRLPRVPKSHEGCQHHTHDMAITLVHVV
jgi:hypothetical protein